MTYDDVCWCVLLLIIMILARSWILSQEAMSQTAKEGFLEGPAPVPAPAPLARLTPADREEAHWLFS